jgi:hypothetical protein
MFITTHPPTNPEANLDGAESHFRPHRQQSRWRAQRIVAAGFSNILTGSEWLEVTASRLP